MKKLFENGIGSNYKTLNNDPISPFHDVRVSVELYPTAWGKFGVSVKCEPLGFNSGLRVFSTEQEAILFARNISQSLVTQMDSAIYESIFKSLLNQF